MSDLTATVCDRIDAVDASQWRAMFPGHPDSLELIRTTADCGMDGFSFASILIRRGEEPILLAPLFDVRFRLASLLEGKPRTIVAALERFLPGMVSPRLLGVGLVEGEWGQIGLAPGLDEATLSAAWRLLDQTLKTESRRRRAALTVFLNFTPDAAAALPAGLSRIETIPCARLPIRFATTEEYLQTLSKNMRKDLRKKLKSADIIEIARPLAIDPWMDRIYELYLDTVQRAELSLGVQRKTYFHRVLRDVPGAHYVLYLHDGQLLAFNLLVEREGLLIDKYFCMAPRGRDRSLYFVSWMENVRYCCEKRLKMYHAGPGAEGTKVRLGAEFVPSVTLFRHRNRAMHSLLSRMSGMIAYQPAISRD